MFSSYLGLVNTFPVLRGFLTIWVPPLKDRNQGPAFPTTILETHWPAPGTWSFNPIGALLGKQAPCLNTAQERDNRRIRLLRPAATECGHGVSGTSWKVGKGLQWILTTTLLSHGLSGTTPAWLAPETHFSSLKHPVWFFVCFNKLAFS